MSKKMIDILPKFIQYEDIPYSAGLNCTECGKADFGAYDNPSSGFVKPIIIGWCDTPWGFMGVFECPVCHSRFRFHCAGEQRDDIDKFDYKLYRWAFMCQNFDEIKRKLHE